MEYFELYMIAYVQNTHIFVGGRSLNHVLLLVLASNASTIGATTPSDCNLYMYRYMHT